MHAAPLFSWTAGAAASDRAKARASETGAGETVLAGRTEIARRRANAFGRRRHAGGRADGVDDLADHRRRPAGSPRQRVAGVGGRAHVGARGDGGSVVAQRKRSGAALTRWTPRPVLAAAKLAAGSAGAHIPPHAVAPGRTRLSCQPSPALDAGGSNAPVRLELGYARRRGAVLQRGASLLGLVVALPCGTERRSVRRASALVACICDGGLGRSLAAAGVLRRLVRVARGAARQKKEKEEDDVPSHS